MPDDHDDQPPGERLRALRQWRGIDQETLAGLIGKSQSWVSKVEVGNVTMQRTADIEAVASVLQVHPDELTGRPHRSLARPTHDVDVMVPAIRRALIDPVTPGPPAPTAELRLRVHRGIEAMWRTGSLGDLAAQLPGLLSAVRFAAGEGRAEDDRRAALEMLAATTSTAFPLLKHTGHLDLALLSAQQCTLAAEELGDPVWRAYAEIRRSHALIPLDAPERALAIARGAIDTAEPHVGSSDGARRVYGFGHLVAAVWAAQSFRAGDAEDHLVEAERIAEGMADADHWDLWFGPQNVAIHRTQVAAVLGRGGELPALAGRVDEDAVPSLVQRCYLRINVALGLASVKGRADDAVAELRAAERIAPMRMRTRTAIVPGLVMQLLGKQLRASSLRELRGLAYRAGVGA